ncbi:Hypothetical protein F387_01971 [Wohlfahrtiimonas chitiniclastica SH04]|uniref:Uncharacterized protein n=1 Tax=Wohlfahrtiimonas chitiniclastica SH04 TaxID=1261130 RepID=L8XT87_9GAMM|nr:hypothetical protein [Wohlfahrtiimonas chitiniclastica]ELV07248.1 Hypothetical protein F387_01971 [Wohlfahrtiimonas chitiniclastica SH04]
MTIVTERISKENFEKYDIARLNKRYSYATGSFEWVIDRERDIWLREYYTPVDRDDGGRITGPTEYDYYWQGHFLIAKIRVVGYENDRTETSRPTWQKAWFSIVSIEIPVELKGSEANILKDLTCLLIKKSQTGLKEEFGVDQKDNEVDASECQFIIKNRCPH